MHAQQHQDPAQTAPIDEPRGAAKEKVPPAVKGAGAIHQVDTKCTQTLIVNADAIFKAGRWTLNPDASETMDALAPMVAKAGKHPARIESYAAFADSARDSQLASEKRAITVRGWLSNHGFVSTETPVQGFVIDGASDKASPSPNGKRPRIEIVMDTCH